MAAPPKSPFPQALRLSIDDVGDFVLLVGNRLPFAELMGDGTRLDGSLVCCLTQGLHDGAQWTVSGGEAELVLQPHMVWELGGRSYRIRQPDESSPLLWLQPMDRSGDVPGVLLLAEGADFGFGVGTPGCAWELEGVRNDVLVSARESGLRVSCEGGVRLAQGEGDFGGAMPFQEAKWAGKKRLSFWNAAREGSAAPLFITLQPLAAPGA